MVSSKGVRSGSLRNHFKLCVCVHVCICVCACVCVSVCVFVWCVWTCGYSMHAGPRGTYYMEGYMLHTCRAKGYMLHACILLHVYAGLHLYYILHVRTCKGKGYCICYRYVHARLHVACTFWYQVRTTVQTGLHVTCSDRATCYMYIYRQGYMLHVQAELHVRATCHMYRHGYMLHTYMHAVSYTPVVFM